MGVPASPGYARGRVRALTSLSSLAACTAEDVVVARHATPSLYPALVRAQAIIAETGGRTCHLATLARELNKPCVTGIRDALKVLTEGLDVIVDGYRGAVEVIDDSTSTTKESQCLHRGIDRNASGRTPVLHFGTYSGAWERLSHTITILEAVQIAAFVHSPAVIGLSPLNDFMLRDGEVSIQTHSLVSLAEELISMVNDQRISFSSLRVRMRRTVRDGLRPAREPVTVMQSYFVAYQIVWLATIAAERLVASYYSRAASELAITMEECGNLAAQSISQPSHLSQEGDSSAVRVLSHQAKRRQIAAMATIKKCTPDTDAYESLRRLAREVRSVIAIREEKHTVLQSLASVLRTLPMDTRLPHLDINGITCERQNDYIRTLGASFSKPA